MKNTILEHVKKYPLMEIQDIANQMLALVCEVAPNLFKNAGPSCLNGKCSEGKMSCGKPKEVQEFYRRLKNNG